MARHASPDFVLFGGSFNPVHAGHVEIARQLAALPGVQQVLVVPAGASPFKPDVPLLPAELRHRMLMAATAGLARVIVLDWELRRGPPSYTADTVAALRLMYPAARLWIAMGMDVYTSFAQWHRPGELLDMAGLLMFPRVGAESGSPRPAPSALPTPWNEQVHADTAGHLVTAEGRRVVWFAPIQVPAVAASAIMRDRDLAHVPEAARGMLAAHWQQVPVAGPS